MSGDAQLLAQAMTRCRRMKLSVYQIFIALRVMPSISDVGSLVPQVQ
jgi:hypothetical protein